MRLWLALATTGIAACAAVPGSLEHAKVSSLPEAAFYDARKPLLDVYVRKPPGDGPFPAVVYLHDCAGLNWAFANAAVEDFLAMGYAVAVVDGFKPRGVASVCGPRTAPDQSVGSKQRAWDAYAALAYLAKRPDIDARHVYLDGESQGADAVIAALEGDIESATPLRFAGGIAYYPYCANLVRPTQRLLILIGEKDDWTAAELCDAAVRTARAGAPNVSVKLVVYPGAYHGFNKRIPTTVYLGHVLSFDGQATANSLREISRFLSLSD